MSEGQEFSSDYIFKITVIGNGGVGKTSLIRRFTQGSFNKEYIKTLGAQFSRFEKIIPENNIRTRLFFWDIAGQKEFSFMRPTFYNGAKAAIIVFDLTDEESLNSIEEWYNDITTYCGKIPAVVFGNKIDILDERGLNYNDAAILKLVQKHNFLSYYQTSAKTGQKVQDAFNKIIEILVTNAIVAAKR
jgi:small GTP-binding protein